MVNANVKCKSRQVYEKSNKKGKRMEVELK